VVVVAMLVLLLFFTVCCILHGEEHASVARTATEHQGVLHQNVPWAAWS